MPLADLLLKSLECCVKAIRWNAELNSDGDKIVVHQYGESDTAYILEVTQSGHQLFRIEISGKLMRDPSITDDATRWYIQTLTAVHDVLKRDTKDCLTKKLRLVEDARKKEVTPTIPNGSIKLLQEGTGERRGLADMEFTLFPGNYVISLPHQVMP